jgi:hypothetical protein
MAERTEFDIDLSGGAGGEGSDDKPWNGEIAQGTLGGDDGEVATPVEPEGEKPEGEQQPPPEEEQNGQAKKNTSGTIDRPYRIFQVKPAEVDGRVLDVPVPVAFSDGEGGTMDTLIARNRDLALTKAARAFGPGWQGTLVAVPIGMWEPEPIFNRPSNNFSVQIGQAQDASS